MLNNYLLKYKNMPIQIKASIWFLVCSFLQKGISFITTPIFTRVLSTSEYGQYNVFISWMSIITVFVSLNLYYGVYVRGLVKYQDDRKHFTSSLQGLMLSLVFLWTIIYFVFRAYINEIIGLTTNQMLLMLTMIWTTGVFNFWATEKRVELKYKSLVAITLLLSLAKPITSLIFIRLSNDKVTARILGLVLVELIVCSVLFIKQMYIGKQFFSKRYWKHALLFNIPLIPHYLSTSILNSSDRIMIDKMVGSSEAGIYSLAYSVSMIMTILNTSLMQTIEPWMYQKIKDNKVEDISKVAYPCFAIVAVINIALIAMAPEVIRLFAPIEYYEAIYVIPPVAMSVFFMFSYTFFAVFEFYFEKTKQIAFATSFGAVLNIVLNFICIKLFGYVAAGYTTLICFCVYTFMHYYFMQKICKEKLDGRKPYNIKIYLLIASIFVIMGFLFQITYINFLARYAIILIAIVMILIKKKVILEEVNRIINIKKK